MTCSNLLIIFIALHWTVSSTFMFLLYWGEHFRCVSPALSREESRLLICCWCLLLSKSWSCQGIFWGIQPDVSHHLTSVWPFGGLKGKWYSCIAGRVSCVPVTLPRMRHLFTYSEFNTLGEFSVCKVKNYCAV